MLEANTKRKIDSDWKYLSEVQKLIYLADTNFLVCKKVYDLLPKDRIKANKFLLLSANNAFNEAIEILHTLLSSNKKEELTIKPLLDEIINKEKSVSVSAEDTKINEFVEKIFKDYPYPDYFSYIFLSDNDERLIGDILADIRKKKRQSGLKDLEEIKKEFEQNHFHKIRHQSAAHKNKHLTDPAGATDLYLQDTLLEKLGVIVKKLRINSYFWFDYEMRNPNEKTIYDLKLLLGGLNN